MNLLLSDVEVHRVRSKQHLLHGNAERQADRLKTAIGELGGTAVLV
jgi:hypothetical protein